MFIGSHISSIGNIKDSKFDARVEGNMLENLTRQVFPLVDSGKFVAMDYLIKEARSEGDSVGGTIECAIVGVPAGVGEPFFESVESKIASLLFSVPAVKAVEFGKGYELTKMKGSEANDPFRCLGGRVFTATNNNGGILGGLSTGMPIIFDAAIKPTASIFKQRDHGRKCQTQFKGQARFLHSRKGSACNRGSCGDCHIRSFKIQRRSINMNKELNNSDKIAVGCII